MCFTVDAYNARPPWGPFSQVPSYLPRGSSGVLTTSGGTLQPCLRLAWSSPRSHPCQYARESRSLRAGIRTDLLQSRPSRADRSTWRTLPHRPGCLDLAPSPGIAWSPRVVCLCNTPRNGCDNAIRIFPSATSPRTRQRGRPQTEHERITKSSPSPRRSRRWAMDSFGSARPQAAFSRRRPPIAGYVAARRAPILPTSTTPSPQRPVKIARGLRHAASRGDGRVAS